MGFFDMFKQNKSEPMMNDYAIDIVRGVSKRIKSFDVAIQFVLEELDAAKDGNETAKVFVKNSGINASEYENAISNSFEEVDGVNGPQQFLIMSCMTLGNMELMVETRTQIVDYIMKE